MVTRPRRTPETRVAPPDHEPTPDSQRQVEQMATLGVPQEDMALIMGIGKTTLKKHYKVELKRGGAKAKMGVLNSLYRQAVGADAVYDGRGRVVRAEVKPVPAVGIFLGKTRCGLREVSRTEHTGANGGAIKTESKKVNITIAPDDLDV